MPIAKGFVLGELGTQIVQLRLEAAPLQFAMGERELGLMT